MKRFLGGLIIILGLTATAQESNVTWHTDVMSAVNLSIKEGKPLFLFFTGSDWCGWCKKLQREVFFKPEFEKWVKKNVILVELDFPRRTQLPEELKKQNYELARMFGVRGYPTGWFVTPTKEGNQVNFSKLGTFGYVAGGPPAWIQRAEQVMANQSSTTN